MHKSEGFAALVEAVTRALAGEEPTSPADLRRQFLGSRHSARRGTARDCLGHRLALDAAGTSQEQQKQQVVPLLEAVY